MPILVIERKSSCTGTRRLGLSNGIQFVVCRVISARVWVARHAVHGSVWLYHLVADRSGEDVSRHFGEGSSGFFGYDLDLLHDLIAEFNFNPLWIVFGVQAKRRFCLVR